jgi:hypothetical protein
MTVIRNDPRMVQLVYHGSFPLQHLKERVTQTDQYARDAVLTIEPDSRAMNLFYVALRKQSGKSTDIEHAFHGGGDTSS